MPRMKLVCDHCGKKYESYQKGKNFHFCSIECRRKAGKLVASAFSKETRDQKSKQFTEVNQTLLNQPEYIEKSRLTKKRIKPTKGYSKYYGRHEHRVVAEKKIGRKLQKGEVVHHIDGDKTNNHPNNLQVMTNSEHARLHAEERWIEAKSKGGDAKW